MESFVQLFLVIIVVGLVIGGILMHIGAKLAKIENATFGQSIVSALLVTIVTSIIAAPFSIVPVVGTLSGIIIAMLLSALILKGIYNTSYGKAFLALILYMIVTAITLYMGIIGLIRSLA